MYIDGRKGPVTCSREEEKYVVAVLPSLSLLVSSIYDDKQIEREREGDKRGV